MCELTDYTKFNAKTIDRWVDEGWEWGKPISHETYENAKNGKWDILLSPNKPVPHEWFGDISGKKILGLASGGGQQMPVLSALGGICTVFDYSSRQLESEKLVADREGYRIDIVCGDMSNALPFESEYFDIIVHPVSNVYVEDVYPIWKECFRVLKKGGILLSGLDNGINFAYDDKETSLCNTLPFNPLKNPGQKSSILAEDGGIEFSHNIEEQIGGQLKAGFRLCDVYDDTNSDGFLHDHNVPSFWVTRSVKD